MQVSELVTLLESRQAGLDCLVVTQDIGTGEVLFIKSVEFETHDDADGSTTCWINVDPQ